MVVFDQSVFHQFYKLEEKSFHKVMAISGTLCKYHSSLSGS